MTDRSDPAEALAAEPIGPVLPGRAPKPRAASGEAEGLTWRLNRPAKLDPLSGWFLGPEDIAWVNEDASFPFVREEWTGLLADPSLAFFYAEDRGVPFAHFCIRANGDAAHLAYLVMDPARRGEGLARPLIRLAAAVAREAMPWAERITLNVGHGNLRAERLYLRLGFARTGLEPPGMFQMQRPIGPEPAWGPAA